MGVIRRMWFLWLLAVAGQGYAVEQTDNALPIFHFNDDHWFELSITTYSRPDTAFSIEDQQNRERARERQGNDNSKDNVLPDDLDFVNEFRLRYQFRFK